MCCHLLFAKKLWTEKRMLRNENKKMKKMSKTGLTAEIDCAKIHQVACDEQNASNTHDEKTSKKFLTKTNCFDKIAEHV